MILLSRLKIVLLASLTILLSACANPYHETFAPKVEALPRMLRIDLIWPNQGEGLHYEIQRAVSSEGPFSNLEHITPTVHLFSDYIGEPNQTFSYRVRTVNPVTKASSTWSEPVSATTATFDPKGFLTELQEAGFRYFYNYAYPGSNLPREGIKAKDSWDPEAMSAVSTGMYFFNIAVGIERGFITRDEGARHVETVINFLAGPTERFFGAYPHWIDGDTGAVREFSPTDNGTDMVETAIIAQGLIFAREYFDQDNAREQHIRATADKLWKDIEWNKFIKQPENVMIWHWSPDHGFSNLPIVGFHEAEICYILGVASPTFPIAADTYWDGWVGQNPEYFNHRSVPGIDGPFELTLGWDYGKPMFTMHYSYMGLDPRRVPLKDGNKFDEFTRQTEANRQYALLNADKWKGYDTYWGLTASLTPGGYRAHTPVTDDNGTIAPTAALSSIPYLPEAIIEMIAAMYLNEGEALWGPFGFYDAFNPTKDWVASGYIGIDVGPIGPMIENYRSGVLWETFMKAPEIQPALDAIWNHPKAP